MSDPLYKCLCNLLLHIANIPSIQHDRKHFLSGLEGERKETKVSNGLDELFRIKLKRFSRERDAPKRDVVQ
jgi:hypothetical protein